MSNLIGHKSQLQQIQSDISHNNLSHAYLLTGASQIGKFTIAKHLAQQLQCPNPCPSNCPTCIQIQKGHHPDTIELNDDGHSIKIKTIRSIIERINMSTQGNYTIILIKNIERMTPAAMNALLKTLEEPPQKTVFFLTSSKPSTLLDTIISRCRTIPFYPPQPNELLSALSKDFPNSSTAEITQLAQASFNKPGKIISLLSNPEELNLFQELHAKIETCFHQNTKHQRFQLIEDLTTEKDNLPIIHNFLSIFSSLLLQKIKETNDPKHHALLKSTLNIPNLLKHNTNKKLLLENLLLTI